MIEIPIHLLGQSADASVVRDWLGSQGHPYDLIAPKPDLSLFGVGSSICLREVGLQLLCDADGAVSTIIIYAQERNGMAAFSGKLANQLEVKSTRDGYRSTFGEPDMIGVATDLATSAGLVWDRWDREGIRYQAEFYFDKPIARQLSIMLADRAE